MKKQRIETNWNKYPSWMKEFNDAEDRASLLRKSGFKAEVIKVCNHFVIDMKNRKSR